MKNNTIQKNIPEGWLHKTLSDICRINMGQSPSSTAYNETGDGLSLIQGNNDIKSGLTVERIWTSEITKTAEKGSLILTVRAPVGVVGIAHDKICLGRGVCSLNSSCADFVYYFLKYYESKWLSLEQGSTFTAVNSSDIRKLKLNVPPLMEQKRIVAILETWDQTIEKLAKKIKIKKNIKKGLMQNLLTGKIRLAGFNDKWETFEVGELLDYEQPTKYIVKSTEYNGSHKIPVLTANKSFILGYTDETDGIYRDTPAIIFDDFTMDNKYVDFPFKVKSSAIKILKQKNSKINLRFVFEKMQLFNIIIGQHKRNYISEYQFLTMDMPSIKEQNAIANIIITADSEIKALEKRIMILKDQKKYLLNNLITGQIRVPRKLLINVK